jgi:hypothetical protein
MSIGAIIAILVVIAVVAAAGTLTTLEMRRRTLRRRFGPEYERLVKEKGARQADAELLERQRRVAKLDLRPLSPEQRGRYAGQWTAIQERFVDDPGDAVTQAATLLDAVRRDRGYPAEGEAAMDALIVHHTDAVDGYRKARMTMSDNSDASTEDLRQALLGYRTLFRDLLGSPRRSHASLSPAGA